MCKAWQLIFSCFSLCALVKRCFYLYRLRPEIPALPDIRLPGLSVISRHSLLLYLLHQPVLYAALVLLPTIL